MKDNVIILGAGASVQAGIPLLADFVERMFDFHQRGSSQSGRLSDEDKATFQNAITVINELDGYHGRAAFDDRNIEDILSILSFDVMGGQASERAKWKALIAAIARTIELSCTVKHDGSIPELVYKSQDRNDYVEFWARLFRRFGTGQQFPTIINFNYDLVLERSLFQLMNGGQYGTNSNFNQRGSFPAEALRIKYHYENLEKQDYLVADHQYKFSLGPSQVFLVNGPALSPANIEGVQKVVELEILKLHGSLNFPTSARVNDNLSPTDVVNDPYILPPIFNKLSMKDAAQMWKVALSRLRTAKKIFIVGYSLPRTDIYMQYFFKTALGPNLDLRKILVFNPVLFRDGADGEDMKKRYGECFAPQFQSRINFQPRWHWIANRDDRTLGTFEHFSEAVVHDSELFF